MRSWHLFLLLSPSAVADWACILDAASGLTLSVLETPPYTYHVFEGVGGGEWLDSGSYSFFSSGNEYTAGANASGLLPSGPPASGSGQDAYGPYTYLSIPWVTAPPASIPAMTNFTCYAPAAGSSSSVAIFELAFPMGLPNASIVSPPVQGNYEAAGNAVPSTRFPSFAAGPAAAVRSPELGYVEYAGCMSSTLSSVGRGLGGYLGGQQSGPLVLFNATGFAPGAHRAGGARRRQRGAGTSATSTATPLLLQASRSPPPSCSALRPTSPLPSSASLLRGARQRRLPLPRVGSL
jgi:hypothetical protein